VGEERGWFINHLFCADGGGGGGKLIPCTIISKKNWTFCVCN